MPLDLTNAVSISVFDALPNDAAVWDALGAYARDSYKDAGWRLREVNGWFDRLRAEKRGAVELVPCRLSATLESGMAGRSFAGFRIGDGEEGGKIFCSQDGGVLAAPFACTETGVSAMTADMTQAAGIWLKHLPISEAAVQERQDYFQAALARMDVTALHVEVKRGSLESASAFSPPVARLVAAIENELAREDLPAGTAHLFRCRSGMLGAAIRYEKPNSGRWQDDPLHRDGAPYQIFNKKTWALRVMHRLTGAGTLFQIGDENGPLIELAPGATSSHVMSNADDGIRHKGQDDDAGRLLLLVDTKEVPRRDGNPWQVSRAHLSELRVG